jgi:hypothetical protein
MEMGKGKGIPVPVLVPMRGHMWMPSAARPRRGQREYAPPFQGKNQAYRRDGPLSGGGTVSQRNLGELHRTNDDERSQERDKDDLRWRGSGG